MVRVSKEEAAHQLGVLLERAARGEEIFIEGEEDRVFRLVAMPQKSTRATFGSARGMGQMSEDFDAPLEDFSEYMK